MYVVKKKEDCDHGGEEGRGGMCWSGVCSPSNFRLDHPQPYLFTVSQWKSSDIYYVVYRVVVAIYFLVWLGLSGTGPRNHITWFIYITNWSFLILNLRLLVQAWVATSYYIQHHLQNNDRPTVMTPLLKVEWVLYNISSGMAPVTSLLALRIFLLSYSEAELGIGAVSIHTHILNTAIVLLDLSIDALPLRLLHFYQPMFFAIIYFGFTGMYLLAGGTNEIGQPKIYTNLDWMNQPGEAVGAVAFSLAVVLVIWLILYALYWGRRALGICCCPWCDVIKKRQLDCEDKHVTIGGGSLGCQYISNGICTFTYVH